MGFSVVMNSLTC